MIKVLHNIKIYASFRRLAMLPALLLMCITPTAWALEILSVQVDRIGQKIVVKGSSFGGGTSFTFGGVSVPSTNISTTQQDIAFGSDVALAASWRGSYKLIAEDGGDSVGFSVYLDKKINDPAPPPPPPPPPGGPDCPCIPGWEASGIPKDNITWCTYGTDGTQSYIIGPRDTYTISALFDPNDIFFDAGNPGNSTSVCALDDSGTYTVAEPLTNQDQYDDCESWLWVNICI